MTILEGIETVIIDSEMVSAAGVVNAIVNDFGQLPFHLEQYRSSTDFLKRYKNSNPPDLFFLEQTLESGVDGISFAKQIKSGMKPEKQPKIIMITRGQERNVLEVINKAQNDGVLDGYIRKPARTGEEYFEEDVIRYRRDIVNKIKLLVQQNTFCQPKFRVGIDGLGRFGTSLLKRLIHHDIPAEVYSNYYREDYSKLQRVLGLPDPTKIRWHKNIESLVGANPTIVVISTGEHGSNFYSPDRQKNDEKLFPFNKTKIEEMLNLLSREYKNLVILTQTPVWAMLMLSKFLYGINNVTSISPDSLRIKPIIVEAVKDLYSGQEIDPEYLQVPVTGYHGQGIILFGNATYQRKSLMKTFPKLDDSKIRDEITRILVARGSEVMEASTSTNLAYEEAPKSVFDFIWAIQHYHLNLQCHGFIGNTGVPISWQNNFSYPLGGEIKMRLDGESLNRAIANDPGIIHSLREQQMRSREFFRTHCPEGTRTPNGGRINWGVDIGDINLYLTSSRS
jgi:CheY-like chemotaxis protein